jgi:hypothetical protein
MELDGHCFEQLRKSSKTGVNPKAFKLPNATVARLYTCVPSVQGGYSSPTHDVDNFRPLSRFRPADLQQALTHLGHVKIQGVEAREDPGGRDPPRFRDKGQVCYDAWTRDYSSEITYGKWRKEYKRGRPMVLRGLSLRCTPDRILRDSKVKSCMIVNCETGTQRHGTLREFFEDFAQGSEKFEKVKVRWSHFLSLVCFTDISLRTGPPSKGLRRSCQSSTPRYWRGCP